MKLSSALICCFLFLLSFTLKAQVFEVDTLQYQGTTKNIVNLVILGDGYTQPQLQQFVLDAKKFKEYLFSQSPYSHYRQYFNVFIIKVPSKESGVKHNHSSPDCPKDAGIDYTNEILNNNVDGNAFVPLSNPDNYFGSSFDNAGLHRLVIPTKQEAIRQVLKTNFPNYNQVIILANSPYYGGSGGVFPTATVNKASNDIAIHELGHSFASLADEYWPGLQFLKEDANRTQHTSADEIPWKKWIGINGIGLYSYGGSVPNSVWFHPSEYCKMQYLAAPFCSVCSEAIIEKIHGLTNPIVKVKPDTTTSIKLDTVRLFKVQLATPDPNTLKVEWFLNDKLVASNTDSLKINSGLFSIGKNTIAVTVTDTTEMVRTDSHLNHKYRAQWIIENRALKKLVIPSVRWGDSIETCYGSVTALTVKAPQPGVDYNWYTESTGGKPVFSGINFITPPMLTTTTFYLEAAYNGQQTKRVSATVKVLPEVSAPEDVLIENEPEEHMVKITIEHPDPNLSYKWYNSETDFKTINDYSKTGVRHFRITDNGTVLSIPVPGNDVSYYVQAVSKANTCFSKRKLILVKATKK